jgi:hypothetical protein
MLANLLPHHFHYKVLSYIQLRCSSHYPTVASKITRRGAFNAQLYREDVWEELRASRQGALTEYDLESWWHKHVGLAEPINPLLRREAGCELHVEPAHEHRECRADFI